jgi:hypothetical protein
MTLTLAKEAVGSLSTEDQGHLAAWILDNLPSHSMEDALEDSIRIANERAEELDSGKCKDLSQEKFEAGIHLHRAR